MAGGGISGVYSRPGDVRFRSAGLIGLEHPHFSAWGDRIRSARRTDDEHPLHTRPPTVRVFMTSWLTYADAGTKFGISADAARHLAIRHHWPRRKPNSDPHGRVEVGIPDDFEPRTRPPVDHLDVRLDGHPVSTRPLEHLAAFEAMLRELRTVREEATERARTAEALATKTLALLTEEKTRTERAEAALATAETREREWWAQSRWRRVLAAWRGG
jgi:hypothetical protein